MLQVLIVLGAVATGLCIELFHLVFAPRAFIFLGQVGRRAGERCRDCELGRERHGPGAVEHGQHSGKGLCKPREADWLFVHIISFRVLAFWN